MSGARGRSRTCDFLLRRQALYPLSYTRIFIKDLKKPHPYILECVPSHMGALPVCLQPQKAQVLPA